MKLLLSSLLHAASMACILASPSAAQCTIQDFTGSSAAIGDGFGRALALDGLHAIVGAIGDDTLAENSGAAYVFDLTSGLAVEDAKLLASDGAAYDYFGSAVAIDGDLAIVGAAGATSGGNPGSAYVFRRTGGAWVEEAVLVPSSSDIGDGFGASIALDGDRAFIGAPHQGGNDAAVYVFEFSTGSWSEVQEIIPADIWLGDAFGKALSLDGDRILISSPFDSAGAATSAGSVYVYEESGGTWSETAKFNADIPESGEFFGYSLDLDGDFAFVGAPSPNPPGTGTAFVFEETSPGTWDQVAELSSASSVAYDNFGLEVNHQAGRLLVGAPTGERVHVFEYSGISWNETDVMNYGFSNGYGTSIVQNADLALIGKPYPKAVVAGCVHVEAFSGDDCNANGTSDLCDIFSGASADVNGNGIPDECECGVTSYCVANANSTGSAASITGTGTVSITVNDFGLTAGPVPNQPGIFFYAAGQLQIPFGEGFRCVGAGTIYRLNPPVMATGNQLVRAIDLNALPSGPVGSTDTWNFQAWYRDPTGGPSGFNLSDAIEVTFCP